MPSSNGAIGGGGGGGEEWAIRPAEQSKYEAIFDSLAPDGGRLPGDRVRPVLLNSGLPQVRDG